MFDGNKFTYNHKNNSLFRGGQWISHLDKADPKLLQPGHDNLLIFPCLSKMVTELSFKNALSYNGLSTYLRVTILSADKDLHPHGWRVKARTKFKSFL